MSDKKPPARLKVIYCDKCGRNDLSASLLKARHFANGKLCDGKLRVAIYHREDNNNE